MERPQKVRSTPTITTQCGIILAAWTGVCCYCRVCRVCMWPRLGPYIVGLPKALAYALMGVGVQQALATLASTFSN